jgi:hypothetical protein
MGAHARPNRRSFGSRWWFTFRQGLWRVPRPSAP